MKLIKPVKITDSILSVSNVAENDYAIWGSGTTYAVGQKVIVVATHKQYEATKSSTNLYPPDNIGGVEPAWIEIGTTNKYKMFNDSYYDQTTNLGSISIILDIGRCDAIGIMNVESSSINVEIIISGNTEYDIDIPMNLSFASNWYEFFYSPIERKTDIVLTDIPVCGGKQIIVTISGSVDQVVKCGLCIPGTVVKIGDSLWGVEFGTENFSKKEQDDFGGYSLIPRNYSKTLTDSIVLPNERTGYIQKLIQPYYTTPALWVADEQFESTVIYGFYRDFSVVLDHFSGSGIDGAQCSITIEGLV